MFRRRDGRSGAAALEFALLAPILLVVLVGTVEAVTWLRSWYRLDRTAAEIANVASQYEQLTPSHVAMLFEAAQDLAAPLTAWSASGPPDSRARMLIGVVSGASAGNILAWSCSRGDAALVARVAGTTTLPNGFRVPAGQTVLVVEVINTARPWRLLADLMTGLVEDPGPIRTYAIVRPRQGQLNALGGACPA